MKATRILIGAGLLIALAAVATVPTGTAYQITECDGTPGQPSGDTTTCIVQCPTQPDDGNPPFVDGLHECLVGDP